MAARHTADCPGKYGRQVDTTTKGPLDAPNREPGPSAMPGRPKAVPTLRRPFKGIESQTAASPSRGRNEDRSVLPTRHAEPRCRRPAVTWCTHCCYGKTERRPTAINEQPRKEIRRKVLSSPHKALDDQRAPPATWSLYLAGRIVPTPMRRCLSREPCDRDRMRHPLSLPGGGALRWRSENRHARNSPQQSDACWCAHQPLLSPSFVSRDPDEVP